VYGVVRFLFLTWCKREVFLAFSALTNATIRTGLYSRSAFGVAGKTSVRLNFATSETVLREVLSRMATAVQRVHAGKA